MGQGPGVRKKYRGHRCIDTATPITYKRSI